MFSAVFKDSVLVDSIDAALTLLASVRAETDRRPMIYTRDGHLVGCDEMIEPRAPKPSTVFGPAPTVPREDYLSAKEGIR